MGQIRLTIPLFQYFSIEGLIGMGSFGAVLKCRDFCDKREYAVKVSDSSSVALREINNLTEIPEHNNIVKWYLCWTDMLDSHGLISLQKRLKTPQASTFR